MQGLYGHEVSSVVLKRSLTSDAWNKIFTRTAAPAQLVLEGKMIIKGDTDKFRELFGLVDRFDSFFPVATHEPIKGQ